MSKLRTLPFILASTMLTTPFTWAAEDTQNASSLAEQEASKVTLEEAVAEARDPESPLHKIIKEIEKICEPQDKNRTQDEPERIREIKSDAFYTKFRKELSRYRIRITLGDLEGLVDTKYFDIGAGYQYIVEPAFRNNEQLRKDIWTVKLGLSSASRINVGSAVQVRFTFARTFGGKNGKKDAITACPYFPTQTPLNTNDIKTKLRDGDGFRFEVLGNAGISTERATPGNTIGHITTGYKTEALFLMDLYRITNKAARARFLGVKNKGEFNIGFDVKNDSPISFVRGRLRDALTLGIGGSLRKSLAYDQPYPLDTLMVDYLFQFSTPNKLNLDELKGNTELSEAAMEEILANIRKFGFSELFLRLPGDNSKDEELGQELLKKAKIAEDQARIDLEKYRKGEIKFQDMRVFSYFKGRMQSDLFVGEGNLWLSEVVAKKGQIGSLDSKITSYNENMQPQYYVLNNTFERAQTRKYFGRNHYNYNHDFDVLVTADKKWKKGRIADIVLRTEIEDTDLNASDISKVKSGLARSLPEDFKEDSQFGAFFPSEDQNNAYLSHRYNFGYEAFSSLGQLERSQLAQKLYEYIDTHPERKNMHLEVDQLNNSGESLGTYAERKAWEIVAIVDPKNSGDESYDAFKIAKTDPIFEKYLVGEFFSSLLPRNVSKSLFGLNLKLSSRESGTKNLNLGEKKVSSVYDAVSFLRTVLNDPNLDMQMVSSTDNAGNKIWIPANTNTIHLPARGDLPKN